MDIDSERTDFVLTDSNNEEIASFSIMTGGKIVANNEVTVGMIESMIATRKWSTNEAVQEFSRGWSNSYLNIMPK